MADIQTMYLGKSDLTMHPLHPPLLLLLAFLCRCFAAAAKQ
jgi:hypothetical protein